MSCWQEALSRGRTYALCRCPENAPALQDALRQLGFAAVEADAEIFCVDMRNPVMLLQDAMLCIKPPHKDAPAVQQAVRETRPRLRMALGAMFPGKLLLCFDTEMLNQAIAQRIEQMNGVQDVPPGVRRLGPYMCVPYGKIFADAIVPNTVTKTLHVEKCYRARRAQLHDRGIPRLFAAAEPGARAHVRSTGRSSSWTICCTRATGSKSSTACSGRRESPSTAFSSPSCPATAGT